METMSWVKDGVVISLFKIGVSDIRVYGRFSIREHSERSYIDVNDRVHSHKPSQSILLLIVIHRFDSC